MYVRVQKKFLAVVFLLHVAGAFAVDGTLDPSFNPAGNPPGTVTTAIGSAAVANAVVLPSGNKILAVGFAIPAANFNFAAAQYLSSGMLDSSFGTNGIVLTSVCDVQPCDSQALAAVLQPNGYFVAAGYGSASGIESVAVARYTPAGMLDTAGFNASGPQPGTNVIVVQADESRANSVAIQADGKIVIAGQGASPIGGRAMLIGRYNTDGSLDTSFNSGGAQPGFAHISVSFTSTDVAFGIVIQPDGKIVVAGNSYESGTGDRVVMVARLTNDGSSLDATFGSNGNGIVTTFVNGNESAQALILQADGKVIIGGFTNNSFLLIRYTSSGLPDPTFGQNGIVQTTIGDGTAAQINGLVLQPNCAIIAGGYSQNVGGNRFFTLARYIPNGALDTTFGTQGNGVVTTAVGLPTQTVSVINGIALQADGKLAVAGYSSPPGSFPNGAMFAAARYFAYATPILSPIAKAIRSKYCPSVRCG